jgi:hypothetical protein
MVESRDAIGRYEQQIFANGVKIPYLAARVEGQVGEFSLK